MRSKLFVLATCSIGICAGATTALAQTPVPGTPYVMTRRQIPYASLSSGTEIFAPSTQAGRLANLSLPFAFRFYDATYNTITVSSYGVINFGGVNFVSSGNQQPGVNPAFDNLNDWIGPFWDFSRVDPGGRVLYNIEGRAPSRVLTIDFTNHNVCCASAGPGMNFQIRLHEGRTGRIQVRYGAPQNMNGTLSGSMGMEDAVGNRPIYFDPAVTPCNINCGHAQLAALAGSEIDLIQDPGIDLAATDLVVPAYGYFGARMRMDVTVANLHSTPLGAFRFAIDVSTRSDFTTATRIYTSDSVTYPPYTSQTLAIELNPPQSLAPGEYYVALIVDSSGDVAEVDEINNRLISGSRVRLLDPEPDLAVDQVVADRTSARAGDTINLVARIRNAGPQAANNVPFAAFLSSNPAITPQDLELRRENFSLRAGETVTATFTVQLPIDTNSGAYYAGIFADPDSTEVELSESNNGLAVFSPLVITGGNLAITTTRLPSANVGLVYLALLNGAGGDPASYRWEISSGRLPQGILLQTSGEVFGRPITPETQSFIVRLTSGTESVTQMLSLDVVDPEAPLTIVTGALPAGVAGQEYAFQLSGTGGEEGAQLSWSAGNLPPGVSTSTSGLVFGIPSAVGTTTASFTLSDGTDQVTRQLALRIIENGRLLIDPIRLPTAIYGAPYSVELASSGGLPPIMWTLRSGTLPAGVTLSPSGTLSGTPELVGHFRVTIRANDAGAGGLAAFDENTFDLFVEDDGTFLIDTPSLPEAFIDQSYDVTITTRGGVGPFSWQISEGRLPSGFNSEVTPETGSFRIRGTPTSPDVTNLLIEATDGAGRTARKAFALEVKEAPPVVTKPVEEIGCGCRSGGTGSAWWVLLALVFFRRR